MTASLLFENGSVASFDDAPQHRPRPLPLFLELLRSETEGVPVRRADALAGLRAYQTAPRLPRPTPPGTALQHGRATLHSYGGSGPKVMFVPSLINPPTVLDLTEHNSLLRWLAGRGFSPLLLDWGAPDADERDLGVAGHVERYLIPMIEALDAPLILAGYCLGGTMAVAAAARLPVAGLVLIASPWRFAGFPENTRTSLTGLWESARAGAEYLGVLPMEILQTAFWGLDPAALIRKFERFGSWDPASERAQGFVALEDWANDGPPLTAAAARELLVDMVQADLPGQGRWIVAGEPVRLDDVRCPVLNILSTTDRIVPAGSAAPFGDRRVLALGHVGMIVGSRARDALWDPLASWLAQIAA